MLEVVFSDSEKGTVKIAKNYREDRGDASSWGIIGDPSPEARQKPLQGKPLGGTAADVLGLNFSLDIGDISCDIAGPQRKEVLSKQFGQIGHGQMQAYWQTCLEDLQRLKEGAGQGEKIRIWYSSAPYSICGFYFVQFLLKDSDGEISAIKLPEYIQQEGSIFRQCNTWGEVEPGELHLFLPLEQKVTKAERCMLAQKWMALREENASLRAEVNGRLLSVPEDFYDVLIRLCVPEGDFQTANLVGTILLQYPLGVNDWWYLGRIRKMIENGELKIIKDHPEEYRRILRKAVI